MQKKRAWIYSRVAHDDETSRANLNAQDLELAAYAQRHGLEIVGSSYDIRSGLTLERDGLAEFHRAVESGDVDILLVTNISRLCRDTERLLDYWHLLRKHGVSIHTTADGEVDLGFEILARSALSKRPS